MNGSLFIAAIAGVGLSAGAALAAQSQDKPEVLVKQRQSAMVLQAKYFGPLLGMLRGSVQYDAQVVARNSGYLDALSTMPWDGFAESTKGEKSRALPAIWTDAAKFQSSVDELQSAINALAVASGRGNEQEARTAIDRLGAICRGCHDDFRSK